MHISFRIGDDGDLGTVSDGKLGELAEIAVGGQCDDVEAIRVAADEIERALSDGARCAEDANAHAGIGHPRLPIVAWAHRRA
jgi:hypothetical protein